jgi:ubiquinone biosynthesis protein
MEAQEQLANERGLGGELPSWLSVLDTAISALEKTAWDLRGVACATAAQATDLWDDLARDWRKVEGDVRELRAELASWPGRLGRLTDTGWMLTRVAASYRLYPTRAALLSEGRARAAREALHARNARRFADASARQGGGVLKVGQLLSTRPDLLPAAWIQELSRLQDAAPPVPFDAVRRRVEADLGARIEAFFERFDAEPVAAASIGQVHRAVTREGATVAVKVTRPDIHHWIELDLGLLEIFLEAVKPLFPPADYPTIAAELGSMLRQELDYRIEAVMMERIADFFAKRPDVVVPRTLPTLCGRDVLVCDFIEGRKITLVLDELKTAREAGDAAAGARLDRILALLLETYARQILVGGVFQADPHPGNFLVTADDRLVLLDFGCTRTLEPAVRDDYLALIGAFLAGDTARVATLLGELGFATASGEPATLQVFAELLLGEFRTSLAAGGARALDPQAMVAKAREVMDAARQDPVIRIPAEFVMLARVFLSLGGLFQHYRPEIDYSRPLLAVLAERSAPPAGPRVIA